jgi:hypothetical protein
VNYVKLVSPVCCWAFLVKPGQVGLFSKKKCGGCNNGWVLLHPHPTRLIAIPSSNGAAESVDSTRVSAAEEEKRRRAEQALRTDAPSCSDVPPSVPVPLAFSVSYVNNDLRFRTILY